MIYRLICGDEDRVALTSSNVTMRESVNQDADYSKVVIQKPWGYEYLIFETDDVAIWILSIKPGHQTSLHCHRKKKTALVVLSGSVEISGMSSSSTMEVGHASIIEACAFHRSKSISADGSFVIEIESPVDKQDLVRFKDSYARV